MTRPICSVNGCERPHAARGWCNTHYIQWRRRSGLGGKGICSVESCEERAISRGLCNRHYLRLRNHGDPELTLPMGRPILGEHPTFSAVHQRIQRERGKAVAYRCVDCGESAQEWSYNNADPNEVVGLDHGRPLAYSLDIGNYDPRCKPCHRQLDRAIRRAKESKEMENA